MPTKIEPLPPRDLLLTLFKYDPDTGILSRISKRKDHRCGEGIQCGSLNSRGHIQVRAPLKLYQAHRIIWMLVTGEDPGALQVEHENTVKTDNRWGNLRLSSQLENTYNNNKYKNNTSGVKGVHKRKDNGMYMIQIKVSGKTVRLGHATTLCVAKQIIKEARQKFHGEFTNHG